MDETIPPVRDQMAEVIDSAQGNSYWAADKVLNLPVVAEAFAAQERIAAALALHQPKENGSVTHRWCRDCQHRWPCSTARALMP